LSRVLFRPAAAAELDEAYSWYQSQRGGLGDEFLQAAQTIVDRLAENALSFPVVHRDRRRAVFPRFPYSLIYRVIGGDVFVLACFHGKRNPRVWRSRR
jgi:plasmid stabilization system protein ParE